MKMARERRACEVREREREVPGSRNKKENRMKKQQACTIAHTGAPAAVQTHKGLDAESTQLNRLRWKMSMSITQRLNKRVHEQMTRAVSSLDEPVTF